MIVTIEARYPIASKGRPSSPGGTVTASLEVPSPASAPLGGFQHLGGEAGGVLRHPLPHGETPAAPRAPQTPGHRRHGHLTPSSPKAESTPGSSSETTPQARTKDIGAIPLTGSAAAAGRGYALGHMQPEFRNRLAAMMEAAKASGHPLSVFSGYRSQEHQNRLFAASERSGHRVARHSHHTAGIAADLRGDLRWAHQHAREFGLRFPMSWENWHIEPAPGRAPAAAPVLATKPATQSSTASAEAPPPEKNEP